MIDSGYTFRMSFRTASVDDLARQGHGSRLEGLIDALKRGFVDDEQADPEEFEAVIDLLLRHGRQLDWWHYSAHIELTDPDEIDRYRILVREQV